jgi:putative addiction module component (TIGR02574 family)
VIMRRGRGRGNGLFRIVRKRGDVVQFEEGSSHQGDSPMPPTLQELGIDRLSVEDRIALAEAIWDSVADEVEHAPLTEAQRVELERRVADSIARPEAMTPWEVIRDRALARARR